MHSKCHSRPLPTERIQLPPPGTPVKALMASLCAPRNQQHANFETKPHDIPKSSDVMVGSCLTICVLPPWLRSAWVMPHLLPRALQAREAAASAVEPLALHEVLDIAVRPGPKARTTPPTSPKHPPTIPQNLTSLVGNCLAASCVSRARRAILAGGHGTGRGGCFLRPGKSSHFMCDFFRTIFFVWTLTLLRFHSRRSMARLPNSAQRLLGSSGPGPAAPAQPKTKLISSSKPQGYGNVRAHCCVWLLGWLPGAGGRRRRRQCHHQPLATNPATNYSSNLVSGWLWQGAAGRPAPKPPHLPPPPHNPRHPRH